MCKSLRSEAILELLDSRSTARIVKMGAKMSLSLAEWSNQDQDNGSSSCYSTAAI
jgi:hypothetical protein